jgi:hypothetical protein
VISVVLRFLRLRSLPFFPRVFVVPGFSVCRRFHVGTDEHGGTTRQHQERQDGGNQAHIKVSKELILINQQIILIISNIPAKSVALSGGAAGRNNSRFGETVSYNTACAKAP